MSRREIVGALCDLYGFTTSDFNQDTAQDIWWYLLPQQQTAVKEYVNIERELSAAGI